MSDQGHPITLNLGDERAAKLALAAERVHASESEFASEILSEAIDAASISGGDMTEILDSNPGALESLKRGEADFSAGRVVPIDEVK